MYKIIRKNKKMNLPILSKNRSNPVVKIPKHIIKSNKVLERCVSIIIYVQLNNFDFNFISHAAPNPLSLYLILTAVFILFIKISSV